MPSYPDHPGRLATFVGHVGSIQEKASDTTLALTGLATALIEGDVLFAAIAREAQAVSTVTSTFTAAGSITWTSVGDQNNTGNVRVSLHQGVVTEAGELEDVSVTFGANDAAKAMVVGQFRGILPVARSVQQFNGPQIPAGTWKPSSGRILSLSVGARGEEGPGTDSFSVSESGSLFGDHAIVDVEGTTGGGAASNITAVLVYGIANVDNSGGNALLANLTSDRDDCTVAANYPNASGLPRVSPAAPREALVLAGGGSWR